MIAKRLALWHILSSLAVTVGLCQKPEVFSEKATLAVQPLLTTEQCSSGQIDEKYASLGGAVGVLGSPISDEQFTPDGVGVFRVYQNGAIYCSPQTGAHEVHGPVLEKWSALGFERGPQGYPITDVSIPENALNQPAGTFPQWSHFQHGGIFALPINFRSEGSSGFVTHELHGAIWEKYLGLGAEQSFLSFPMTDETSTDPNGDGAGLATMARYNLFLRGAIYWTPASGAHEMHGAILARWKTLSRSILGYPVTDELPTPDNTGRFNHFQSGGNALYANQTAASVYWTPTTGAVPIYGPIHDRWARLGWERSCLGYPTDLEFPVQPGTSLWTNDRQDFQRGSIQWGTNTIPVSSCGEGGGGGGNNPNQSTVTIQLVSQPPWSGPIPYVGVFPVIGTIDGNLISASNPASTVALLFPKLGQSTADCSVPADVVYLAPNASLSPQDLSQIYGVTSPRLPVPFVACIVTSLPPADAPTSVLLRVTYSHTP